ncbi:MAG: phospholipase D-like domain-containing protein [Candidatus Methanoperedens sp.]|nr:phospholipase D-like domain-containing protein [Candidatus Methanoperedens sp.]
MKTYCDSNAGSQIEPVLWNAKESVWIISPWLGKDYAKRLASLSQKGIEVRIITSLNDFNIDSLEILKASENTNLRLMVLDKKKVAFIHAKIYIIDNKYGFSGSANLTYSGLNSSVENLSIAETNEEVQKIRNDFMNLWMTFDRKSMSNKELSSGSSFSIKDALPLSINCEDMNNPNIKGKELVYHPYYFFEFSLRASVGKSPPVLFENSGFVVLDALTRLIINDNLLSSEIKINFKNDYVLKTENKYRLTIHQPIIRDFREAEELVLDYIIKKNTKRYTQNYRNRSYHKIFVPYGNSIRFIKSGFVQVPIWYIDIVESERRRYENVVLGASGKKWGEVVHCPECQKKILIDQAIICERCGTKVCQDCIKKKGLIFKEKLCVSCHSKSG